MAKRYELSEAQWQRIAPALPGKPGDPGRSGVDNRVFVNGVLWVLRSGAHWHDLPERYGKWKTVHKRFTRWAKAGVWERVFASLAADPDNQYLMLDTTLVRAHQQAATGKGGTATRLWGAPEEDWPSFRTWSDAIVGYQDPDESFGQEAAQVALHEYFTRLIEERHQALGRSRGGLTTKIHMLADALGRPLRFILTPGQAHDSLTAATLLDGRRAKAVLADKAYDTNAIRALIADAGMVAVIPSKRDRRIAIPHDPALYRQRNQIERCFNKLKHFRRIATRYDRRDTYFLAFIQIAAAILWMR